MYSANDLFSFPLFRESRDVNLEYSVLSNQICLDNIMSYLSYKDVHRLSMCCRAFRELSAIEFERRKNGTTSKFFLFRIKNVKSENFLRHPKCDASASIHTDIENAQQELEDVVDRLRFHPKIAFIFSGNVSSKEHQRWSVWFKHRMPKNCTLMNVLSKTAVCGSISEHVYEVHHNKKSGICGIGYLLFGAQHQDNNIKVFQNLKELVSITNGDEPVKGILYFTKIRSRKSLASILAMTKEKNNDLSIAFGGLIIDSLDSFLSENHSSKIECAGLVFSGSCVNAASTIIEDMDNVQIRDSMIRFRDSIQFDINDKTKNTICFLLSCIEHSPSVNYSSDYTESESDIFHTIFPSNVKVFGLSGHGEFGQISGVKEAQKKITYQFSCIMVLVQFP